jgi:hypothetical protein
MNTRPLRKPKVVGMRQNRVLDSIEDSCNRTGSRQHVAIAKHNQDQMV